MQNKIIADSGETSRFAPRASARRRRFLRMPFRGVVHLNDTEGHPEGGAVRGCDLSPGGMGVYSPASLGTGRPVAVDFLERNMRVRGVTRHESLSPDRNGWRIGIEFAELQPELVEVILRLAGDKQSPARNANG